MSNRLLQREKHQPNFRGAVINTSAVCLYHLISSNDLLTIHCEVLEAYFNIQGRRGICLDQCYTKI